MIEGLEQLNFVISGSESEEKRREEAARQISDKPAEIMSDLI